MFYKNSLTAPKKVKYKSVGIDFSGNFDCDGDISSFDRINPLLCINFNNSNNILSNSYGESDFACTNAQDGNIEIRPQLGNLNNLKNLKYFVSTDQNFNANQIMVVEDYEGKVTYCSLNDGTTTIYDLVQLDTYSNSKFFNYYYDKENYLLISTNLNGNCKFYVVDGGLSVKNYETQIEIFDICSHNGIVFLVVNDGLRDKVYFFEDGNPFNLISNYHMMNCIGLPTNKGKVMRLLSYNDYLYIVCEYGIVKITSYRNQKDYNIEEVYTGTSRIVEDSIVVGGDNIIFSDINSIYVFNGNSLEKINLSFESMIDGTYKWQGCACYNDGKYYLSTRLNYFDDITTHYDIGKNNCLIVFDTYSKKVEVCSGMSIKAMEVYYDSAQSRIAILAGPVRAYKLKTLSKTGLCNGDSISKKIYKSQKFNAKSNKEKIIRKINLTSHEDIKLILHCDKKDLEYNIHGSVNEQCIVINERTTAFSVTIESETVNPLIKNMQILVGVYE